jgi:hypothetical protein
MSMTTRARLIAIATQHQLRLQQRHGIHLAYLIVTALYIALLRFVPHDARPALSTALIASDPAFLGFFFIGGMIFLERGDRTHLAIATSPLSPLDQLIARFIAISSIATLAAATLSLATLAKNKVEGLAIAKLLGLILIAPIAATHADGLTKLLFGLSPAFWTPELLSPTPTRPRHATLLLATTLQLAALYALLRRFTSHALR